MTNEDAIKWLKDASKHFHGLEAHAATRWIMDLNHERWTACEHAVKVLEAQPKPVVEEPPTTGHVCPRDNCYRRKPCQPEWNCDY